MRIPSAVQRRQGLTCTSVFQANQITHASAGRQQQQVIGMGELEVHLRMSFCTR